MGKSERKEPIQSESIRIRFSEKQKKGSWKRRTVQTGAYRIL